MKELIVGKEFSENIFCLSCLETYLLLAYKQLNIEYKHLFFKSFLPLQVIYNEVFINGKNYVTFSAVERLYDTARRLKLIEMDVYEGNRFVEFFESYDYCCIQIKPRFILDRYNIKMWRNDHYILLYPPKNNAYLFLNDSPRDFAVIEHEELMKIYDGHAVAFNIPIEINADIQQLFLNQFMNQIPLSDGIIEPYKREINLEKLRDMIGILKVLRRRLVAYCKLVFQFEISADYLNILDRYYTITEYYRLKQSYNNENLYKIINDIYLYDINLLKNINQFIFKWRNQ